MITCVQERETVPRRSRSVERRQRQRYARGPGFGQPLESSRERSPRPRQPSPPRRPRSPPRGFLPNAASSTEVTAKANSTHEALSSVSLPTTHSSTGVTAQANSTHEALSSVSLPTAQPSPAVKQVSLCNRPLRGTSNSSTLTRERNADPH